MRIYEIHLPLTDGTGEPIEQVTIDRVRDQLLAVFGSFLVPKRRAWKYDGSRYAEIVKIEVVTTDKVTAKRLKDLKHRLEESLQQSNILITTHRIQTV